MEDSTARKPWKENYAAGKPWKMEKQQHIMEVAYQLFSEKGIVPVSIVDVAKASGVGKVTAFRYFTSKLGLVMAIGTWKWEEYITQNNATLSKEKLERMTGAELLKFFLDSFLDLYRNHPDLLRFNYEFNSFLRHEKDVPELKKPYMRVVDKLSADFHEMYERGMRDGTLNKDISEEAMFSSLFHIMLAAVTRYAIGLVYLLKTGTDPESELILLENALLREYTVGK